MKYVKKLKIIVTHPTKQEQLYVKVYIPKYIDEQIETILSNREIRFQHKCLEENKQRIKSRKGYMVLNKKFYNVDSVKKPDLIRMLLQEEIEIVMMGDNIGEYWLLKLNDQNLDDISVRIQQVDDYFKNKPVVKEVPVKESPMVKMSDFYSNIGWYAATGTLREPNCSIF